MFLSVESGDEVFFGVGEDRRVTTVGALRHADEVAQRTRIVFVFGAVVERLALLAVERCVVDRLQHLDCGQLVEVQVHGVERLVAVVIDDRDVDGLVAQGIDIVLVVGDGEGKAVGILDFLRFPYLGGILAIGVQVDGHLLYGTAGVQCENAERSRLLVARLDGVARNVEYGRRVDDADVQRAAVDACRIDGVVAVDCTEYREVDAFFFIRPALHGRVAAGDDGIGGCLLVFFDLLAGLFVGLLENPLEAVDLLGVERQEPHEVDGVAHGHGNGVGDGVGRQIVC